MRIVLCALLGLAACKPPEPPPPPPKAPAKATTVDLAKLRAFGALPARIESPQNPLTDDKIALGKKLYFEKKLSLAEDISCNTCHLLDKYGVDGLPVSLGHKKQKGDRNAPTVYNAAGHASQFWDGRAPDVEAQAKMPILNPKEMAMPKDAAVIERLKKDPDYVSAFKKAFPSDKQPVNYDNLGKAIGAFERTLTTPSRFDRFFSGDSEALTDAEKAGLNTFVDTGCVACHSGPYFGGTMFQRLGLLKPWPTQTDQGRYEVTKVEADKMMFKVPGLRNVEKTAPYFHDGSEPSLDKAVKMMAEYQLGKQLSDQDTAAVVAFLKTLTGEIKPSLAAAP